MEEDRRRQVEEEKRRERSRDSRSSRRSSVDRKRSRSDERVQQSPEGVWAAAKTRKQKREEYRFGKCSVSRRESESAEYDKTLESGSEMMVESEAEKSQTEDSRAEREDEFRVLRQYIYPTLPKEDRPYENYFKQIGVLDKEVAEEGLLVASSQYYTFVTEKLRFVSRKSLKLGRYFVLDADREPRYLMVVTLHHGNPSYTEKPPVYRQFNPLDWPVYAETIDVTSRPNQMRHFVSFNMPPEVGKYQIVRYPVEKEPQVHEIEIVSGSEFFGKEVELSQLQKAEEKKPEENRVARMTFPEAPQPQRQRSLRIDKPFSPVRPNIKADGEKTEDKQMETDLKEQEAMETDDVRIVDMALHAMGVVGDACELADPNVLPEVEAALLADDPLHLKRDLAECFKRSQAEAELQNRSPSSRKTSQSTPKAN